MTSLRPDRFKVGEIWLAKWSHEDGRGYKYRPVLILGTGHEGVIALKLTTSTTISLPGDYLVEEWREAGLLAPTIARTTQVRRISFADFGRERPFGKMSERDIEKIRELLSPKTE